MNALESLADNLINGNLKDARKRAERYSYKKLVDTFKEYLGFSDNKAFLAANYLKTGDSYQEYCDAQ
jgi:hypothetical protein